MLSTTGRESFVLVFIASWLSAASRAEAAPVLWAGNGHLYELVDETTTWTEANAEAKAAGGHLVTVTSPAENEFVAALARPKTIWIGLTDVVTENDFRWVTCEPFLYSNWSPGEPNNSPDEDYVYMHQDATLYGRWNDAPDDNKGQDVVRYVIEYEPTDSDGCVPSPCCATADDDAAPEVAGKACNRTGVDPGTAGCAQLDAGTCIGGGLLDPPWQGQLPFAGCICVSGECVSGGGGVPHAATASECTRDAVTGCDGALGATH